MTSFRQPCSPPTACNWTICPPDNLPQLHHKLLRSANPLKYRFRVTLPNLQLRTKNPKTYSTQSYNTQSYLAERNKDMMALYMDLISSSARPRKVTPAMPPSTRSGRLRSIADRPVPALAPKLPEAPSKAPAKWPGFNAQNPPKPEMYPGYEQKKRRQNTMPRNPSAAHAGISRRIPGKAPAKESVAFPARTPAPITARTPATISANNSALFPAQTAATTPARSPAPVAANPHVAIPAQTPTPMPTRTPARIPAKAAGKAPVGSPEKKTVESPPISPPRPKRRHLGKWRISATQAVWLVFFVYVATRLVRHYTQAQDYTPFHAENPHAGYKTPFRKASRAARRIHSSAVLQKYNGLFLRFLEENTSAQIIYRIAISTAALYAHTIGSACLAARYLFARLFPVQLHITVFLTFAGLVSWYSGFAEKYITQKSRLWAHNKIHTIVQAPFYLFIAYYYVLKDLKPILQGKVAFFLTEEERLFEKRCRILENAKARGKTKEELLALCKIWRKEDKAKEEWKKHVANLVPVTKARVKKRNKGKDGKEFEYYTST